MSKRKDILTIVIILIILLLVAGVFLARGQNQKTDTKTPVTEEEGEFTVKTERDATDDSGASDTFEDKTSTQNQSTDAGEKGGSKTLEIISSDQETEGSEDARSEELIWLPDAW